MTESKTVSSQEVLEKEFLAYLLFSLQHTLGTASVSAAWRSLDEEDRTDWRKSATQFILTAHSFFPNYGNLPLKKLIPVLRAIITVPAAEAYSLLEGVAEE